MKPAIGTLMPDERSKISSPCASGGQLLPRTKSSKVALLGANVLVSCWKPPMAIFMVAKAPKVRRTVACVASARVYQAGLFGSEPRVPQFGAGWSRCSGLECARGVGNYERSDRIGVASR